MRGRYSYRNSPIWGLEIYLKATLPNSSSKFDLYIHSDGQVFPQVEMKYEMPLCDNSYATAINITPPISVSTTNHFPATLSTRRALKILYIGCCGKKSNCSSTSLITVKRVRFTFYITLCSNGKSSHCTSHTFTEVPPITVPSKMALFGSSGKRDFL